MVIGTQFRQVRDDATGLKIDADYGYSKLVGGEGAFEFAVQKDLQANASRNELFAIRSRWQDKGMGRSDFTISGGDVTTPVTASECWSETFGRTYYKDSANFSPAEGDEKSCAFAQASYPAPKS